MTITTFLAIVIAVALGVALAPAVRWVLALLVGTLWLLLIVVGFLAGAAWLFVVPWLWRDFARELGLWNLAIAGGLLGISAGALKLLEWYDRFTRPPRDTVEPQEEYDDGEDDHVRHTPQRRI